MRALADWSQGDLAKATGLNKKTIQQLEQGGTNPTEKTERLILEAFERADIEVRDGRIGRVAESLKVFEGDNCYLRLLDDVAATMPRLAKPELLIFFGDDAVSPPEVIERYRAMRAAGLAMRQLVKEGNTYLMGPLKEYRYFPGDMFVNRVFLVYGDKFATITKGAKKRVTIQRDLEIAAAMKFLFDNTWSHSPMPERSDAEEKF